MRRTKRKVVGLVRRLRFSRLSVFPIDNAPRRARSLSDVTFARISPGESPGDQIRRALAAVVPFARTRNKSPASISVIHRPFPLTRSLSPSRSRDEYRPGSRRSWSERNFRFFEIILGEIVKSKSSFEVQCWNRSKRNSFVPRGRCTMTGVIDRC